MATLSSTEGIVMESLIIEERKKEKFPRLLSLSLSLWFGLECIMGGCSKMVLGAKKYFRRVSLSERRGWGAGKYIF
jgi:hypothetical protein